MAKVVVVANADHSLTGFRGSLLQHLLSAGHEVTGVAPTTDATHAQQLKAWGADFYPIQLSRAGTRVLAECKTLWAMHRAYRQLNPDVVLNCSAKPVIYGGLSQFVSKRGRRVALISGLGFLFMAEAAQTRRFRWVKRLYRFALRHYDQVIVHNPDDLATLKQQRVLSNKTASCVVLGSGVDVKHFKAEPLPSKPVFVMVARLLKDKGVREYVQAATALRAVHPEARCLLVGRLDENPAAITAEELAQWQADGAIEYLGELADVRVALRQANIFVLPSYREGLSRAVIEAMAMGRAIITTDVPGCRQTISDGVHGKLVSVASSESVLNAMMGLVKQPEQIIKMGKAARQRAEQVFEQQSINQQMLQAMGLG